MEYRYKPDRHIDVMDMVTLFGAGNRYPLAAYAIGYGIPFILDNGASVIEMAANSDFDGILRHVISDVEATAALYEKWQKNVSGLG